MNKHGWGGFFAILACRFHKYQPCDSKICLLPASVPVEWQFQIVSLDRQRAPHDIHHK
jgi:hypothetical protein